MIASKAVERKKLTDDGVCDPIEANGALFFIWRKGGP